MPRPSREQPTLISDKNQLYYGDNLDVLRRHFADESVDLIYLDPPFNSEQNYNVLFTTRAGQEAAAQQKAFEDTWSWDKAAIQSYQDTVVSDRRMCLRPCRHSTSCSGRATCSPTSR